MDSRIEFIVVGCAVMAFMIFCGILICCLKWYSKCSGTLNVREEGYVEC